MKHYDTFHHRKFRHTVFDPMLYFQSNRKEKKLQITRYTQAESQYNENANGTEKRRYLHLDATAAPSQMEKE